MHIMSASHELYGICFIIALNDCVGCMCVFTPLVFLGQCCCCLQNLQLFSLIYLEFCVLHDSYDLIKCRPESYLFVTRQAPLLWNQMSFRFRKQSPSPPLRLGLTLSFLIKLRVRDGSGDPETSHSYAAISLDFWQTSHDAPLLTPSPPSCSHILSMYI